VFVTFNQRKGNTVELIGSDQQVVIHVDLDPAVNDYATIARALGRVILGAGEDFASFAPEYWEPFLHGQFVPGQRRDVFAPSFLDSGQSAGSNPTPNRVTRVRISQGAAERNNLLKVEPKYPAVGKQLQVQGSVVLVALIGTDGTVKGVAIVSPVGVGLDDVAVAAVQHWTYKPYYLNGRPAEVETQITVKYELR
jgi:TonB family protein